MKFEILHVHISNASMSRLSNSLTAQVWHALWNKEEIRVEMRFYLLVIVMR